MHKIETIHLSWGWTRTRQYKILLHSCLDLENCRKLRSRLDIDLEWTILSCLDLDIETKNFVLVKIFVILGCTIYIF